MAYSDWRILFILVFNKESEGFSLRFQHLRINQSTNSLVTHVKFFLAKEEMMITISAKTLNYAVEQLLPVIRALNKKNNSFRELGQLRIQGSCL